MATPEPVSVAEFFSPPTRTEASISPDGTRIACLAPWRNRLNVYMVKDDEGNGSINPDNVIEMYGAVDRFLAEHLGAQKKGRTA